VYQVRIPVDLATWPKEYEVVGTLTAGETFGEVSLCVGAKSMSSVFTVRTLNPQP